MFNRIVQRITRSLGPLRPQSAETLTKIQEVTPNPEIDFNPLDPVSGVNSDSCQCPVTRQTLKQGDRIFQCRACLMAYSEEGWDFLRQENKGCCCGCGSKKTIVLLVAPTYPGEETCA